MSGSLALAERVGAWGDQGKMADGLNAKLSRRQHPSLFLVRFYAIDMHYGRRCVC